MKYVTVVGLPICFWIVFLVGPGGLAQNQVPQQEQGQNAEPAGVQAVPTDTTLGAKVSTGESKVGPQAVQPSALPANVLEDGTPMKLRISRSVSSADARAGETVDFEVEEDVRVGNTLVIPKGGLAWATVTEAQPKRRLARGGKLNMNIDSVRLANGQKVPLRAVKEVQGGGHVEVMTGAMAATSIVFWPAAPVFLLMHGKDITVPKGTEITAYINGNTPLDLASFAPPAQPQNTSATPAPNEATLDIVSIPAGADIEVDGSFVGNAPSSIGVSPGEHTVKVTKPGFSPWERKVKTSTGSVKIAAQLEPVAAKQ